MYDCIYITRSIAKTTDSIKISDPRLVKVSGCKLGSFVPGRHIFIPKQMLDVGSNYGVLSIPRHLKCQGKSCINVELYGFIIMFVFVLVKCLSNRREARVRGYKIEVKT